MSSYSIIGFSEDSDVRLLSTGFVLIIGYLVVAEYSLSALDTAVRSTAYAQAVQSLYKELVIMGISGFVLTVLLSTSIVPASAWVFYMEIADVTLFFSSLIHVFFSFSLILHNVSRHRDLREKLKENVHHLVDRVSELPAYKYVWNPFSSLRAQVELRVLRIMFLKQFKLDRAFDFARYITLSEEHHIIEMLHVSPVEWLVVVFFIALNFIRVEFKLEANYFSHIAGELCDEVSDLSKRDTCELATAQCLLFALLLYSFLAVVVLMAVVSRVYEWRLMRINGPQKHSETCNYLLEDELHDVQGSGDGEDGRMTLQHMKQTIEDLKKVHENRELRKNNGSGKGGSLKSRAARANTLGPVAIPEQPRSRKRGGTILPAALATLPVTQTEAGSEAAGVDGCDAEGGQSPKSPPPVARSSSVQMDDMLNAIGRRRRSSVRNSMIAQQRIVFITHTGIQSGLFLFNSPGFYFYSRDICNLLLCLYYALYFTTFIAMSLKTQDPIRWNIVSGFGLVAAIVVQSYVIMASSIINAVSKFNSDVVGKVIEEQEEDAEIEKTIREKILHKVTYAVGADHVTNISRVKKAVNKLFSEIQTLDGISDNLVSKEELKVLLQKLNIFFSKRKFDRAFEIIDIDMSGAITLSEFIDFIFPDAAREERIRSRIMKLEARGLIRKHGGTINAVPANLKKKSGIYRQILKVKHAIGITSANSRKYSAAPESFDESDEVAEFKRKQKGIKARAAGRVNRALIKMKLVKAIAPEGDPGRTQLLNTLAANEALLTKHRLRDMSSMMLGDSSKLEGESFGVSESAKEEAVASPHSDQPESGAASVVKEFREELSADPAVKPTANRGARHKLESLSRELDEKGEADSAGGRPRSVSANAFGDLSADLGHDSIAADPASMVTEFVDQQGSVANSPKSQQESKHHADESLNFMSFEDITSRRL